MSLTGKVILVAGASSGMGRAAALAVAEAGARVVLFARRAEPLSETEQAITGNGGEVLTVAGDATDEADAGAAVRSGVERFGRLDALVNCVGANIRQRTLSDITAEGWRTLMAANLDSAFVLTQAVLPVFRQQRDGLLVHVSSRAAKRADASGVGYQASKAGVAALAHATMEEERANGVRVTVLYPGLTDTPLVEQRPTPPTRQELADALQPEDVARMCLAVLELPARAYVPELLLYPVR